MITNHKVLDFFFRSAVGLAIGVVFAFVLSEGSFLLLDNKETVSRGPQRVDLVIPFGTAEQVAAGVYNRSLPLDMVFVQGDLLVVRNEDVVDHQLGPIWVPAGTSGVLELNQANQYSYECSFQPTQVQGIDVRPIVDTGMRFQAILAIALPTGMMLAVYSYLLPARKKPKS
jgi:hypothetical protein